MGGDGATQDKTPAEIFAEFDGAIRFLHDAGYEKVAGVGKSFGGGMMLAHIRADLFAKVLWAPAIGFSEAGANVAENLHVTFGSLGDLLMLTVGDQYLAGYPGPVCFIHGTADNVIPFTNSVRIQASMPNSVIVPIEGADHSYKDKVHEAEVVGQSISFISKSLR